MVDGVLVGFGGSSSFCCRWCVGGESRNEDVDTFREGGCDVDRCDVRWF